MLYDNIYVSFDGELILINKFNDYCTVVIPR